MAQPARAKLAYEEDALPPRTAVTDGSPGAAAIGDAGGTKTRVTEGRLVEDGCRLMRKRTMAYPCHLVPRQSNSRLCQVHIAE